MQSQILELPPVATILADKEIRKLFGNVIFDAEENRINPTGIEVRLGKTVVFLSTDEEKELAPGMFLRVSPGESVLISSYETFDLRHPAIEKAFPGCGLMVLITPTTTMMREGIMQCSTKIESGWDGTLNWGLRNGSVRDLVLGYGEPIFKLTFFLLKNDEVPDIPYGERPDDKYQSTRGVARSTRTIPANIPKKNIVSSSVEKLDPAKQLREAGYPFNHISSELQELHGKWVAVSTDVVLLKDTIATEAKNLRQKVDDSQKTVLEKVESLFDRKFLTAIGGIIACGSLMFGAITFLQGHGVTGRSLGIITVIAGFGFWWVTAYIARRRSETAEKNK